MVIPKRDDFTALLTRAGILITLLSVLTYPLCTQTFYGSILGTVTDTSGGVVPGAEVILTNTGTAERRTAKTDASGNYQFVNLVPGTYRVDISSTGFKRLTRGGIVVEVQSAVRIDAAIEPGNLNQVVEVTAQTPLLQTDTTALGQVIQPREVQQMPLNGRNVLNLVALVPGVVAQGQALSNPTTTNNTSWGNYQIGGGLANQSAAFLDGGPLNINYVNMISLVPTQDAIQEFRVQTNNVGPEFGRFSGGVVNLTTKSGTNAFHGTAYEYLRNTVLNGNTFFNNRNGVARPAYNQNQFGANVGGPVVKDKTFFFFGYEGYRQRQAQSFQGTVPTTAFRGGDFSDLRNPSGNIVPIYDALTTCGKLGNAPCQTDASGNPVYVRQPFPGNKIPATRLDPTATALTRLYPLPNTAGLPYTGLDNFATNYSAGGDNDQYNARVDQNISDKQHIFGRYTAWSINNLPEDPYGTKTGMVTTDFSQQAVVADTYTFNPTTIGDIRVAFLRYAFDQHMQSLGVDLTTFNLPANLNAQIPQRVYPIPIVQNYTEVFDGTGVAFIKDRNNSYSIVPSLTKIAGRHTLKFGFELRRLDFNFAQSNNTSGSFNFDNGFTSVNPFALAGTGYSFASFMLGYGSSGNAVEPALTSGRQIYQGYYANDSFQVTSKLTLNFGVRWELPFGWTESYNRLTTLLPGAVNPLAQATGLPLRGKLALVASPDWPDRHSTANHWDLFAPRTGFAYRATSKTVLRGGYGIFYVPNDAVFGTAPQGSQVNSITTPWVSTIDGGITPANALSNPFPTGILLPPGHNPAFQSILLGASISSPIPHQPYGYVQQWNLNVERQLWEGTMLEVAYSGSKGVHIPRTNQVLDQLPDEYLSLGTQLQQQVPNPFYGLITSGTLAAKTVSQGQLLRPFPEYTGVGATAEANGNSTYHSMQVKLEKRFGSGGTLLAAYTWSKFITDVETATSWNERNVGNVVAGIQDYNNLRLERSLSSNDVPQNLVVSYVVDLPFGKGKKLLGNVGGLADKLVSGWGVNGISTFQSGIPLGFTTAVNLTNAFGGSSRPNVVAGCDSTISGSAQSRLNGWFNNTCFQQPPAFTFGTESRTDPHLRSAGIANWDFAVFKKTPITENVALEFRSEFFNLFNRVQFGQPGQTFGLAGFGVVSNQQNSPRLVQFALRLEF